MKTLVVILLCCLLIGCGGSSTPTPPQPTITGAWSGTVVSASGGTANTTGNLVQGVTNPDGSIQFSGSLSFTGSCITLLQISGGKILGSSFALTGTFTDGTALSVTATINAADTAINGTYNSVGGSVCASDHGSFSLTKQ